MALRPEPTVLRAEQAHEHGSSSIIIQSVYSETGNPRWEASLNLRVVGESPEQVRERDSFHVARRVNVAAR